MDEFWVDQFLGRIVDFGPLAQTVGATALAAARIAVVLAFLPVFTELALPPTIRLAGALALSLPFLPIIGGDAALVEMSLWYWCLLVAKEAAIGVVLMLIIGLPFWAVDMAGDILETQRGLGNESVTDPSNLMDSQLTGRLLFLLFLLFVLASGGLMVAMDVIYESFVAFPVMVLPDLQAVARALIDAKLFDALFDYGLLIGLPAILILFLIDLAVGLATRFAPQMNVLQLSLAIKALVALAVLPFYVPVLFGLIEPMMVGVVERFRSVLP